MSPLIKHRTYLIESGETIYRATSFGNERGKHKLLVYLSTVWSGERSLNVGITCKEKDMLLKKGDFLSIRNFRKSLRNGADIFELPERLAVGSIYFLKETLPVPAIYLGEVMGKKLVSVERAVLEGIGEADNEKKRRFTKKACYRFLTLDPSKNPEKMVLFDTSEATFQKNGVLLTGKHKKRFTENNLEETFLTPHYGNKMKSLLKLSIYFGIGSYNRDLF